MASCLLAECNLHPTPPRKVVTHVLLPLAPLADRVRVGRRVSPSWPRSASSPPRSPTASTPCPRRRPTRPARTRSRTSTRSRPRSRRYYGDTPTRRRPGAEPSTAATRSLHTFAPTGAYAKEMARHRGRRRQVPRPAGQSTTARPPAQPAIVFDIDDTTLNTYNYEIYSNFVFNPTTNAAFVNAAAVPGRARHADLASRRGGGRATRSSS